ncbi:MAG: glycosyltransferase family 39 protein [Ferruginibacter sp.]
MSYKKRTALLIVFATLIRCIIAVSLELGNDEVYYRMYAQYLQWNYFDHPPMVAWLIRFSTANLLLDNEFFIRLGAIISAALTTWLLFLSGKKLSNEYTGFLAAVIYTATIYGSVIAGIFILPDSPQMVCWSGALYLLIGITENTNIDKKKKWDVLRFGFITGVGMLCKIHTSFLWLGFLLFILFYNRDWLKRTELYISGAITLLFFYPVIKWNIDNHFITYLYHSKRINVTSGGLNVSSFFSFLAGQFFYCNPVIFPFIILGTIAAYRNRLLIKRLQKNMLLLCSLPLIVITFIISLFKDVLPHWPGPAYSGLILLTACYFSIQNKNSDLRIWGLPKPTRLAILLLAILISAGSLIIHYLPGTLGKKEWRILGEGDFTLDMYGWENLKPALKKIVQDDAQAGLMKTDAVIISNKWFTAAHIDYYVAMPLEKDLVGIGDTSDIHEYAWLNKNRKALKTGDDAYCLVPSESYFDVKKTYSFLFKTILPPKILEQKRNGQPCRIIYVYRLKEYGIQR